MNILNSKAAGYAAAVLAGGVVVYLLARQLAPKVGEAARAVGTAVNPVSDQNLAYRGVNAVGEAVTGRASFSLGSWLYDVTNDDYNPNAPAAAADESTWWGDLLERVRQ